MSLLRWWRRWRAPASTYDDELEASARRIAKLRAQGARIGPGCVLFSGNFSREPWLVELGANVAVAGSVSFVAHDGVAFLLRDREPNAQLFGRIVERHFGLDGGGPGAGPGEGTKR